MLPRTRNCITAACGCARWRLPPWKTGRAVLARSGDATDPVTKRHDCVFKDLPQGLFLAVRPMRCSKQPLEQTDCYPQKQDDHRECSKRRGQGQKRNEECTTEFQSCED